MSRIWAVCKDAGGTNNLLPILPLLRKAGHEVTLFLHEGGKGEVATKATGEAYETASTAKEVIEMYGQRQPDLLMTSMCSGGGIGRDLIPICRKHGVPTVAIQDTWGARVSTDFADEKYHPDHICVNDEIGAKIVRDNWGSSRQIAITGYPRLDLLANLNRENAVRTGREMYGITDNLPIVLYSGQIWDAGSMLRETVMALNHLSIPCHLLTSRHPRMATEAPADETTMWDEAEADIRSHIRLHTSAKSSTETILASTLVIGQYTTVLVDAAALGKQNISLLYPEHGAAAFQREFGGVMDEFPLVSLGCTVRAKDFSELDVALATALGVGLNLQTKQSEVFRLDGNNAERTARAILDLL